MSDATSNPGSPRRGGTILAAGLLLFALAVVVLYTSRNNFSSPLAIVIIAAIGLAALLLQLRLRRGLNQSSSPAWLNILGVIFAVIAVFADSLHLPNPWMLVAALLAIVCFAASGIVVLNALRKPRI